MIILTGDTHGVFDRVYDFVEKTKSTKEDVLVVLGDVGFNYYLGDKDDRKKKEANEKPITWFCIKGNHEKYAGALPNYEEREAFGGVVYVEAKYPNILFAKDGEVYTFEVDGVRKSALVIGGAYSVDRNYRVAMGMKWYPDEQPSEETKKIVEEKIEKLCSKIDYIFSHTCPKRYEPTEWFISMIEQDTVDKATELWLDTIYEKVEVDKWYCGHYHGSKVVDNIRFMFDDFVELGK